MWPPPSAEAVAALVTAVAGLVAAVASLLRTRKVKKDVAEIKDQRCRS